MEKLDRLYTNLIKFIDRVVRRIINEQIKEIRRRDNDYKIDRKKLEREMVIWDWRNETTIQKFKCDENH